MNKTFEPMEYSGERYVPELRGITELEHLHRYLQACHFAAGNVILDIASGEGYGSAMLAQTAARVFGVDSSEESVEHARNRYHKDNLEFKVGSCAGIPLADACVDIVVSFETIEHHDRHEEMMQEVKRVLRQDGMLLISTPDRYDYSVELGRVNPFHVKELYQHEFKQLLEHYFKHIVYFGQRVIYGSGLFAELPMPIVSYSYGHSIAKASAGMSKPAYWIAAASDASLPDLASSVLEQRLDDSEVIQSWNRLVSERDAQLASVNLAVAERDRELTSLRQVVGERDAHVANLISIVAERDAQIANLNHVVSGRDGQLALMVSSRSWKMTSPLRELRRWIQSLG